MYKSLICTVFTLHNGTIFRPYMDKDVQLDLQLVLSALYFLEWLKGATYFLVFLSNVALYLPNLPDR